MFAKRSVVIAGSGVLVLCAAWLYLHPAWQSSASIRESLLQATPLGSSMAEVRSFAERKGWIQPNARLHSYMAFITGTGMDVSAFSGELRHDPFPYRTSVGTTWEFNRSNQLVTILVLRHEGCMRFELNYAASPNRRPRFPLGIFAAFACAFCAPPAVPAAVGEPRR
jgi:hypothetical protein